jgi:Zinc knuckle
MCDIPSDRSLRALLRRLGESHPGSGVSERERLLEWCHRRALAGQADRGGVEDPDLEAPTGAIEVPVAVDQDDMTTMAVSLSVFCPEVDDAEGWITRFERAAGANGWNDERKVLGFPCYLQGPQLDWFDTLERRRVPIGDPPVVAPLVWRPLKSMFIKTWGTRKVSRHHWTGLLANRMQREGEPVGAYIFAKASLCDRVDPGMTKEDRVQWAVSGLRPDMAECVIGMSFPGLDELLERLCEIEEVRNKAHKTVGPNQGVLPRGQQVVAPITAAQDSNLVALTGMMRDMGKQLRTLQERVDSGSASSTTIAAPVDGVVDLLKAMTKELGALKVQVAAGNTPHGSGQSASDGQPRENSRGVDGSPVCFYCKKSGHFVRDCRKKKRAMESAGAAGSSPGVSTAGAGNE